MNLTVTVGGKESNAIFHSFMYYRFRERMAIAQWNRKHAEHRQLRKFRCESDSARIASRHLRRAMSQIGHATDWRISLPVLLSLTILLYLYPSCSTSQTIPFPILAYSKRPGQVSLCTNEHHDSSICLEQRLSATPSILEAPSGSRIRFVCFALRNPSRWGSNLRVPIPSPIALQKAT